MKATRVPGQPAAARISAALAVIAGIGIFAETAGLVAQQAPATAANCVVTGSITGLGGPLPGVSITVRRGETVQTATSTGVDGTFKLTLPDNSYQLTADLTGFDHVQKDVTVSKTGACAQTVDLTMTLTPRASLTAAASSRGRAAGPGGRAGAPGANGAAGANGFEALAVNQNTATAGLDLSVLEGNQQDLTPAGFGSEAVADAFAVTGDAARVDRSALNERQNNFNRGEFQIPDARAAGADGGFGNAGGQPTLAGLNGGNQGGFQNQGGNRGRGGNNNNFQIGGRGGRQSRMQVTANYGFSGSALESPRKQLRSDVPISSAPYGNHDYGFQVQGPLKIPGILKNENNSTTLQLQFSGNSGTNLFDQYATVPTDALRNGDFSSVGVPLYDPQTGQPFAGNVIPVERMNPASRQLLQYYPAPNLSGDKRNYHYSTTSNNTNNRISARIQHNFSGQQAGGGGGRGGNGGGNTNTRSNVGQAGKGRRLLGTRTNVNMNLNVQYQQQDRDQLNVFSTLGGKNQSKSYSIQDTFSITRGRAQHQLGVQYNHSNSATKNRFTNVQNVSGDLGIQGISDSPEAWGLPRLSFSSISGLSDVNPNLSNADRASVNYSFRHPFHRNHQIQLGGDFRYDVTTTHTETNANGQFVYTGAYTGQLGGSLGGLTGLDFADFLLGYPQQASIAAGPGDVTLTSKTMGLFIQDDWRVRPSMTVQLGVRYDVLWPFTESHGHMVNLDVTPDFTAAAPVEAGETGEFSGAFPKGLIETDKNNISPKLGFAWRGPKQLIVRSSYEVNYNNNTYSAIARQLSQQPPYSTTGTNIGSITNILLMEDALTGISQSDVRNNYGIDKNYVFGLVQQGVVNVQRQLGNTWLASAQYTHTRGSNLDIVRAPNRDAGGLRIEGVQPFSWTSSEGNSVLNSGAFSIQKRASGGLTWTVTYTLAKSRDNSPSIGGGGASANNIAQDDRNIDAEWALSNFDVRHNLTAQASLELPFGPNRRWLYSGGWVAALLERWQFNPNFTIRSGQPYTVIVRGASRDIAAGVNGALRADYDGEPTTVADPSIDKWFNTSAFSIPLTSQFGNSPRNIVFGPGSKSLNLNFSRNVALGGNRNAQVRVQIRDVLNMTNYTGIDTNLNSRTFGEVTGVSGNRTASLSLQFRF